MRVRDLHAGRHYYVSDQSNWLALGSGPRLILLSDAPYAYVNGQRFEVAERTQTFTLDDGTTVDAIIDSQIVPSSTGWRATSLEQHSAGALMIRADRVTGAPQSLSDEGGRAVAFIVDPKSIRAEWDEAQRQIGEYRDAEHAREVAAARRAQTQRSRWVAASERLGDATLNRSRYLAAETWTGRLPYDAVVLTLDEFEALARRAVPDPLL